MMRNTILVAAGILMGTLGFAQEKIVGQPTPPEIIEFVETNFIDQTITTLDRDEEGYELFSFMFNSNK